MATRQLSKAPSTGRPGPQAGADGRALLFRRRPWRSLKVYLSVAFIACAVAPLALLVVLQFRQIDEAIRRADAHQSQMAGNLARDVAAYVEMHRRALEAAAHQVTVTGDLQPERLGAVLRGLHAGLPGFINLYFADARAVTIAFEPPVNAAGQSMAGVDFSDRWHYKAVVEGRRTVMSPVMKGRGGTEKLLITIVVPYFGADGGFRGFVLGALDLARVGALVEGRRLGGGAYAVIVDGHGAAIHYPGFNPDDPPRDLSAEPVFAAAAGREGGALEHYSTVASQRVRSAFVRLGDPGWILWTSRPLAERDAARHEAMRSAAWLVMAALVGSALLAWVFTARTDGAVAMLLDRMHRIRRGDAPPGRSRARTGPLEFAVLADGLDDMATELAEHRQALLDANATLEQRATLEAVFESLSDALVIVDPNGRVIYANRNFGRMLGLPAGPPLGRPLEPLLADAGGALPVAASEALRPLLRGAQERAMIEAGGRHFAVTAFDVRDEGGGALGRGCLARDVTSEREVEQLKDNLVGIAAHEFKTPVTALRMRVESLLRTDAGWSESFRAELLQGMREDVERLQALVSDWLDAARIESKGLRLSIGSVGVRRLVEGAIEAVRSQTPFAAEIEVPEGLSARLDRARMQQVLVNLLSNAVRYCNRPPEVAVRARRDPQGWLVLEVEDNGIGIAPEDQARVFDRFFQVTRGNTRRPGGTGLGLAIARGIVAAHGGELSLRSVPGEGSVFMVRLPPDPGEAPA